MNPAERIRELEAEVSELRRRLAAREAHLPAEVDLYMQFPLPVTIYQPDGLALAVNPALVALYRTPSEAIVGRYNIFDDTEAQQRGDTRHFRAACAGTTSHTPPLPYMPHYTNHVHSIEDRILWSWLTYFPIRNSAGEVAFVGEITFDITDQVRSNSAERHLYEALAERDRRFRALFDNNGLAIALVDATGRLIEANAALCRMLNLSIAQLRGNPMGTYTHPDDVAQDKQLFAEMVSGKRSFYQLEKRYIHANGHTVYARLTNSTVRDEHGQVQFVMRLIEDITARYEAEAALRANRALLHALIDELPAHIYCKDMQGRYLLVNRPFAAALGRTIDEVIQKTNFELMPPDVARAMQVQDEALLRAESPQRFEEQYEQAGQTRFFESVKFILRDDDGQPYAICGISNEITERKRAEQERLQFERHLLETQKLESLGVMAGGIAHDFNNLLVAILGNASLALEELPGDAPVRQSLAQIELAARRASDLTRQMLAYAGKSPLIFQPVDLNQIIDETARLLQSSLPRHISLHFALNPNVPAVNGDPSQLRQIIMNLVINGAEAITASTGEVVVRTDLVQSAREDWPSAPAANLTAEQYVVLTVTDTGTGMDAATRARIFEPFFSTKFAGRGLGLAAVLGIVRSHQGAILVESAPGAGATFQVLLPVHDTDAAPRPESRQVATPGAVQGTVLVIDDEADVRAVTQQMLRRIGLQVFAAADAVTALTLIDAHGTSIHLALIDVTMPDMPGPQLAAALVQRQPTLRFIVMSGHNEEEALQGFPQAAIAGFLAKPFTLAELTAQIRSALAAR